MKEVRKDKQSMRSEKGVTLTALVVYMAVFTIIIGIVTTISSHFYKNVGQVSEAPQYIAEFNEFSMFFIADVKNNTEITSATGSTIVFGDGTKYEYKNNSIYRNNEKIVKNVKQFTFTASDYTKDDFTKKIVNVTAEFGKNNETITRNIDFVLKYW